MLVALLAIGTASQAFAKGFKFTKLNPPGSTYTYAFGVNNKNKAVGTWIDANGVVQGFLYSHGKYKIINFPGAVNWTRASGIDDSNVVAGDFLGSDHLNHGFLLKGSHFEQYDVGPGTSTFIYSVNNTGSFAGSTGLSGSVQGFVNVGGAVTLFTFNNNSPTEVFAIDSATNAVGWFADTNLIFHGFYRDAASGTITQIDYPGSSSTACLGLNDAGAITGWYLDAAGVSHGFTLMGGKYRTHLRPSIAGVNNLGGFVGYYTTTNQKTFGYLSEPR